MGAGEALDIQSLAHQLGASAGDVRNALGHLEEVRLLCSGVDEGLVPIVPRAGRQFVERKGHVPREVLHFLPRFVDDLYAREALVHGGKVLVREFREHVLLGNAVDHAVELVPPSFAAAVSERVALDLFAAAVALMARLSDEKPAGCLAEEIMAVELLKQAERWLEDRCVHQRLSHSEAEAAARELGGLFELFDGDDVLALFALSEPAGTSAESRNPSSRQLEVLEQRMASWFEPFGWTIPTGYMGE
ncbi:MAG: hypothetical protein ACYDHN_01545 [Solirubrobacteraceae bacterium]